MVSLLQVAPTIGTGPFNIRIVTSGIPDVAGPAIMAMAEDIELYLESAINRFNVRHAESVIFPAGSMCSDDGQMSDLIFGADDINIGDQEIAWFVRGVRSGKDQLHSVSICKETLPTSQVPKAIMSVINLDELTDLEELYNVILHDFGRAVIGAYRTTLFNHFYSVDPNDPRFYIISAPALQEAMQQVGLSEFYPPTVDSDRLDGDIFGPIVMGDGYNYHSKIFMTIIEQFYARELYEINSGSPSWLSAQAYRELLDNRGRLLEQGEGWLCRAASICYWQEEKEPLNCSTSRGMLLSENIF